MASVNQCNFIGRAGRDAETKFTPSGQAVANVSIACSEKFKNKAGEMEEKTEWVNLVFWGKLAEIVGEYVTKGKEIYVSGRMQTRQYEKDGVTRYATDIVCDRMQMLSAKGEHNTPKGASQHEEPPFNDSDDIPF